MAEATLTPMPTADRRSDEAVRTPELPPAPAAPAVPRAPPRRSAGTMGLLAAVIVCLIAVLLMSVGGSNKAMGDAGARTQPDEALGAGAYAAGHEATAREEDAA